ncbi:VOC family protein [Rhizobium sp. RU36D]|uniref:VOC family protein n=1 Tax=Rhizobium sp. RU36D TaxID=1907415 RepID=UPI0009D87AC0|nr:VOC family protein [Rhizobium sp. RU36D]SMD19564.1 catechol 2,3-dioxygenase [Rhizobium sp. RU36D]
MHTRATRRQLIKLAGATTLAAAMAGALRAEGIAVQTGLKAPQSDIPFALSTPMHVGEAALRVRDLPKLKAYYQAMLGLEVISERADQVTLGAGGMALLHLLSRPDAAIEGQNQAGLYHIAFLMPTRRDLASWLVHVARTEVPLVGFADHSVSEAVYLADPEGNGLEVYSDRSKDGWRWSEGRVTMGTNELNIDDIIIKTGVRTDRDDYTIAPAGLSIGHMHLRVGALETARAFYRAGVGMDVTAGSDERGASFLSSGGYHHHLGTNVWQSRDAGQRDDKATGLDWFSLRITDGSLLDGQRQRLAEAGYRLTEIEGGIEAVDPWGTRVRLFRA